MTDCIRIAMWSGPRNLSTAMMRSFGSRADTHVTDEPFYGAYLRQTGDPQPMMDRVMASMDCDWHGVARAMSRPNPAGTPIWYQKHMAHHMVGPIAHHDLPGLRHWPVRTFPWLIFYVAHGGHVEGLGQDVPGLRRAKGRFQHHRAQTLRHGRCDLGDQVPRGAG